MTEKQYKLEQWTSSSLYYSFPDGNLHHSIGEVIARVENDLNSLYNENEELKSFKQRVFDLIDKTIEEETQIAENIEEVAQETRPYAKAINRITIKTLENLKLELQE